MVAVPAGSNPVDAGFGFPHHCHLVNRTGRTLASLVALSLIGAHGFSAFVVLHEQEFHHHTAAHAHSERGQVAVGPVGHSHGGHDHGLPGCSTQGARLRSIERLESTLSHVSVTLVRPVVAVAACVVRVHGSHPPRVRPPLSLSTVLRI